MVFIGLRKNLACLLMIGSMFASSGDETLKDRLMKQLWENPIPKYHSMPQLDTQNIEFLTHKDNLKLKKSRNYGRSLIIGERAYINVNSKNRARKNNVYLENFDIASDIVDYAMAGTGFNNQKSRLLEDNKKMPWTNGDNFATDIYLLGSFDKNNYSYQFGGSIGKGVMTADLKDRLKPHIKVKRIGYSVQTNIEYRPFGFPPEQRKGFNFKHVRPFIRIGGGVTMQKIDVYPRFGFRKKLSANKRSEVIFDDYWMWEAGFRFPYKNKNSIDIAFGRAYMDGSYDNVTALSLTSTIRF